MAEKEQQTPETSERVEISAAFSHSDARTIDEKRLLRRMDILLLPILGLCQVFNFLDRINISNAKLAGMTTDLHLNANQFGWILSIFFFGYILCEVPSNVVMKKFRPSRWIPLIMCSWGTIVMLMSVATTYAGLLVCRLITGCIESGMYPGILYYLSFWYTRREMGKRVGAIVCAVTAAGAVGGLLATGIQYMDGALGHHAWQWIFILEGIPSILMGIIVFFFLPDFPGSKNSRRYFTEEEGAWLVSRLKDDHTDASDQKIHWKELTRGLIDYKIWLYTLIFFCQSCPVYSLAFFLPTIIQDMYISTSIAGNQGLTVPVYMFGLLMVILFSWSSDRFKDRLYHNFVSEIICIVGFIILLSVKSAGVLYFATMLTTLCFASAPTLIAWNNDNSLGTTRSALAIGLVVVGGNLSGVLASQMYKDAPYYFQSHLVNFCLQILSVILVLVLRFALKRENRKVDAMGVEARGSAYGEFRYTL